MKSEFMDLNHVTHYIFYSFVFLMVIDDATKTIETILVLIKLAYFLLPHP